MAHLDHSVFTPSHARRRASPGGALASAAHRSAIPLALLVCVAGAPIWGGYVTFVLVLAAWKAAGRLA